MSTSRHTPGPCEELHRRLADAHDVLLAIVKKSYLRPGKHEDCNVHPQLIEAGRLLLPHITETLDKTLPACNAHTDLLAACERLLDYVQDVGGSGQREMMEQATAAIAKAKGEA